MKELRIEVEFFYKKIQGKTLDEIKSKLVNLEDLGSFDSNYCHVYFYNGEDILKHWTLELFSEREKVSDELYYFTGNITKACKDKLLKYIEEDMNEIKTWKSD